MLLNNSHVKKIRFLDCTLRDGGYHNNWDFSPDFINQYLGAVDAAGVDVVEMGFRSLKNEEFLGACAFTTDYFLNSLVIPSGMMVSVMVNGKDIIGKVPQQEVLETLFPNFSKDSPVSLVRIACHAYEYEVILPAVAWLKDRGYQVGLNLMQISECTEDVVKRISKQTDHNLVDVLYFADSLGSMAPNQIANIIQWFRTEWKGAMGIHAHDNMGLALSNTLRSLDEGVTWVDSTVTGMGRGPGNTRTEELAIELAERSSMSINIVSLMSFLTRYLKPLQEKCKWGTNTYYYLAGKYRIHPTYIQTMLSDLCFSGQDILAVIDYLRAEGGINFNHRTLNTARHFYDGVPKGEWNPKVLLKGRDILLLGTGPGVASHRDALEHYIRTYKPLVLALNTQSSVNADLINMRIACNPVRLLADCHLHTKLPQPLIAPYSMLPADVRKMLDDKEVLDFGIDVQENTFEFFQTHCIVPTSLVMAYAFAIVACGESSTLYLAGFDGYPGEDPRNAEMNHVIMQFKAYNDKLPLIAITPTKYDIQKQSVYGMII